MRGERGSEVTLSQIGRGGKGQRDVETGAVPVVCLVAISRGGKAMLGHYGSSTVWVGDSAFIQETM